MSRERIVEKRDKENPLAEGAPIFRLRKHVLFIICIDIELFKTSMVIVDNNNNFITSVKS